MVTLILDRAASGKSSYIMEQIRARAEAGERSILIVPEQYSHDAERFMCSLCGDRISLYAEVLSFTRLASKIETETGSFGSALDAGGRLLVMYLALKNTASGLKAYGAGRRSPEFLTKLLGAYDEFKASSVAPADAAEKAVSASGPLGEKLGDLSLIFEAYEALIPDGMYEPCDRLRLAADRLEKCGVGADEHIYIDGFTDFTAQELYFIDRIIKNGASVTVSLTCDGINGTESAFAIPRNTARRIIKLSAERGAETEVLRMAPGKRSRSGALAAIEKGIFSGKLCAEDDTTGAVELYRASGIAEECEFAASRIASLIRENGYRRRDIAVVARGWDDYEGIAEHIFEKYGVPVLTVRKSVILQKPIMLFITSALDIIYNNWDYVNIFRYLKTGLSGISDDDRDELENYVLKWGIRGRAMWTRDEAWSQHPDGYGSTWDERSSARLKRVDSVRRAVAYPLGALSDGLRAGITAGEKTAALCAFLESVGMRERLTEKAEQFRASGNVQLADEYAQLWDILVSAMEQTVSIIGSMPLEADEFSLMFRLLLSQYSVGTIPAALDRVGLGDMTRMKRRDLKCLFVLGATDMKLPSSSSAGGLFSDDERDELLEIGIDIGGSDLTLEREYLTIYSSLTLPSEKLIITYPASSEEKTRPSFVVTRIAELTRTAVSDVPKDIRKAAVLPCFELAASGDADASRYFEGKAEWAKRLSAVKRASSVPRGRLSEQTASQLYAKNMDITASRIDKYEACRFSHFLRFGLKLKTRTPAGLDAPEAGTFMHYILENVARDAEKAGGFGKMDEEGLRSMTRKYAAKYAEEALGGLRDRNGRFKYLFRRLSSDAERIVLDMAGELARSDFKPLDFELRFARGGELPPASIADGDTQLTVSGVVDRVDGWVCGDKLYLRVVDYKTGKKSFSLSDVWYGMGLQMLIYLFVLQEAGAGRYGKEVIPAGVLYAPARDAVLSVSGGESDEEIASERAKKLMRSGLVLCSPEVIEAMESGSKPKYIPVKFTKDGLPTGDSLVTAEQMGLLRRHIENTLRLMSREIRGGGISADPYYRSETDNACMYCEYFEACHFDETMGDSVRALSNLKTQEAWALIEEEDSDG